MNDLKRHVSNLIVIVPTHEDGHGVECKDALCLATNCFIQSQMLFHDSPCLPTKPNQLSTVLFKVKFNFDKLRVKSNLVESEITN